MATQFCQKCKQTHPGRTCDYDEKGECAETLDADENAKPSGEASREEAGGGESASHPASNSR